VVVHIIRELNIKGMKLNKNISFIAIISLLPLLVAGCGLPGQSFPLNDEVARPAGWTEESHGSDTAPDYDMVFPQDKVNRITITISPDNWQLMQDNMTELFGEQGNGGFGGQFRPGAIWPGVDGQPPEINGERPEGMPPGRFGPPPDMEDLFPDGFPPADGEFPDDFIPGEGRFPGGFPPGGDMMPGGGLFGMGDMTPENPVWVPATIEFNGITWTNVGVRYKGNSSLMQGWRSGTLKMPLKMDFDEFESEYPEIQDQRFYGFKQLSLSNCFNDPTYMRDAIASDILEKAGLVAAETAHYEVILDYGDGPVDLGLYVVIEVIDDTVIERYFGDDPGNIYEGEGAGASLAEGTFNRIEGSFQKENNRQEDDWGDIEELYKVLHSELRTTDAGAWRAGLEEVFDVDVFLEWLAISSIIQHWDSYGSMSHNYYLYHDLDTGRLVWISWDHNEVFKTGGDENGRAGMMGPGGMRRTLSLSRDETGDSWPLIRFLLDDPVYHEKYLNYIGELVDGALEPEALADECRRMEKLIESYAIEDSNGAAFASSVQELIDRIYQCHQAAADFATGGS
jgi:spore coat protein H